MNDNVKKLLELIKENPDVPIVPMVDSEVVADDSYNNWLGHWGHAEVSAYLLGQERVWFKFDDPEDVLSDVLGYEAWEAMTEEEAKTAFDSLDWVKCIAAHIMV